MRRGRTATLSVPQFRALVLIESAPAPSLSRVAGHVGLALPSATALVAGLVERRPDPADRRRVTLALTEAGCRVVRAARRARLAGQGG